MPATSQAQRRWVYGVKGKKWAKEHHFDNAGKLPARASKKKPKRKGKKKPKPKPRMPKGY